MKRKLGKDHNGHRYSTTMAVMVIQMIGTIMTTSCKTSKMKPLQKHNEITQGIRKDQLQGLVASEMVMREAFRIPTGADFSHIQ